jgi:protein-S-isoprenylcysteine O-methyltransferase Ste14
VFNVRIILFTLLLPGTFTVAVPYALLAMDHGGHEQHGTLRQWLGIVPITTGALMLLWCIVDFARFGRGTLAPVDPPKHLVIRGLYRYVRNPMYVGVTIILLGEYLLFDSVGLLLNALGFFVCTHCFVVYYEEPSLSRRFGESYARYRKQVRRWLPGLPKE